MRAMTRIAASTAVLAATACAVPSRDNPNDSTNAPDARLVTKVIPAPESCAESGASEATEEIHASRGACIALDATESTDPQNDPLSYTFTAQQGTAAEIVLGETSTNFFVLTEQQRRVTLRPGPVVFGVEVEDTDGAKRDAKRTFTLENEAPIALTDSPRLLDREVPWTTESCLPVSFDASRSTDPDGDAAPLLHYSWTFVHGAEDDCTNAAPADAATVTRLVKRGVDQRVAVTLVVDDGDAASDAVTTFVDVRAADPWVDSPYDPATFIRLDSSFEYLEGPGTGRKDVVVTGVAPDLLAIAFESTSSSAAFLGVIAPDDSYSMLYGPIPLPDDDLTLAGNPDGNGSSVWTFDYSGGGTLRRYDLSGAAGAEATYAVPASAVLDLPQMRVDSSESVWMTSFGATTLVHVDPAGNGTVALSDPQRVITGIAVRPGTSEVWAVEASNPTGGDGAASALVQLVGGSEVSRFDLGLTFRMGIGWIDDQRAWIGAPGEMQLIDLALLMIGADPVLQVVPLELDPSVVYADPVSKTCWATVFVGADTTYEIYEDGFTVAHVDKGFASWQEPDGRLWVLAGDSYRGHVMSRTGIAASVTLGSPGAPRADGAGGFWIESATVGSVRHYDMRGSTTEIIATAIDGTGGPEILFPATRAIYTSPDGAWLWTLSPGTPGEISRFDLSTRPPVRSLVVSSSGAIESLSNTDPVLLVSDPGATESFAWVRQPQGVGTIAATGTKTTRLTIPPAQLGGVGDYPQALARVPGSNRACVAWQVPDTSPIRVRMIEPDALPGATVLSVDHVVPAGMNIQGILGTHDDVAGDRCWLFYGATASAATDCSIGPPTDGETRLAVFAPGMGAPVATFTDPSYGGTDFHASTANQVWYRSFRCDPTNGSLPIANYEVRLDLLAPSTIRQTLFRRPN